MFFFYRASYKHRAPNGAQTRSLVVSGVFVTAICNRCLKRFDRESRCMLLAAWQAAYRIQNVSPCKVRRIIDYFPFDHLRQRRSADKSWRAAISQESRRLDPSIANAQTQAQAIAANGICLFGDRVPIREFSGVPRIGEMIFEDV
jgi:hypothetical protein